MGVDHPTPEQKGTCDDWTKIPMNCRECGAQFSRKVKGQRYCDEHRHLAGAVVHPQEALTSNELTCCVCGFPATAEEKQWHEIPALDGSPRLPFRHKADRCWQLARAERERLTRQRDSFEHQVDLKNDGLREQRREIERLRAALDRYGRHTHPNCHDLTLKPDGSFGPRNGCLCGFDAALSGRSAPETSANYADLLLEGRQWAETLRGVYIHRGNRSMADHVTTYLDKLERIFPPDPRSPVLESAQETFPKQPGDCKHERAAVKCPDCGIDFVGDFTPKASEQRPLHRACLDTARQEAEKEFGQPIMPCPGDGCPGCPACRAPTESPSEKATTELPDWKCTVCDHYNDPSTTQCTQCEWSRKHTIAGVLHERWCGDHPCVCGAVNGSVKP